MEKKKFKIEELKIQSFITDVNLSKMKGGESGEDTPNWCGGSMDGNCWTGAYCGGGGDGDSTDIGVAGCTPGSNLDCSWGCPSRAGCGSGGGGEDSYMGGVCEEPS